MISLKKSFLNTVAPGMTETAEGACLFYKRWGAPFYSQVAMVVLGIIIRAVISVVIPTLNESRRLPELLSCLSSCPASHELIICDGGSSDQTVEIAKRFGAIVVTSKTGRGTQLAAGAKAACGDVLLFLHADSELHPHTLIRLEEVLRANPDIVGGNFRVQFEEESLFCRIVEVLCAALRRCGMYYGDSGIFVRSETYDAIGGFKDLEIMEDVDFVLRLERHGKTCCITDPPLRTSVRRFRRRSPLSLLFLWIRMHVLYAFGVKNSQLAKIYDSRSTKL